MQRLILPERATINESYQLIKKCTEVESEPGEVELSAENTGYFGPFGVALVAATLAMRRKAGRATSLTLPHDADARRFVDEVGLMAFAHGEATGHGTLEVRQLLALDAVYTQTVTSILMRGVPGITEDSAYLVQLCLNELLQNVFEWAHSPIGCCVHTRWYAQTQSVRLAVVDRGIGIPAALRRERVRGLQRSTDAEVIEAAVTTPLLTSRSSQVGGLGLKHIREWVCGRGGSLTVISLGAKVLWAGTKKVARYKSAPVRGTAIEIDFRPTAAFRLPEPARDIF